MIDIRADVIERHTLVKALLGRPFDVVHVTQSLFPEDPRPRREAVVAADTVGRVAVVALRPSATVSPVGRYGRIAVLRLKGSKRRASPFRYIAEYGAFLARAYLLFRSDPRFRDAKVVHVHSLPDFLVAAAAPARRRGARIVLDLHEIFPEFARAKFPGFVGRVVGRIALAAERWSRRQADVVLTVNTAVHHVLASRPAHQGERLVIVHNAPDERELGPPGLTNGALGNPVRLVYHGTLTGIYGLDIAIDAVAHARDSGLPLLFHIYGGGPDQPLLDARIAKLRLGDTVQLCGTIPHDQLRRRLTTYDAAFVPTRLNVMTQYSLSTKVLEYVHLGTPVIAPRIPTYLRYFGEHALWYYQPNDPDDAARAVTRFCGASPEERAGRARTAQDSMQTFSWEREGERLATVYRELLYGKRLS